MYKRQIFGILFVENLVEPVKLLFGSVLADLFDFILEVLLNLFLEFGSVAVSYTHLDVYKRQGSGIDWIVDDESGIRNVCNGDLESFASPIP